MNKLIILGASGHGKVIADIAANVGYTDIVFLDDDITIKECSGFPVVGKTSLAKSMAGDKIIAIGNASVRESIHRDIKLITLIHPNAVIGRNVEIGEGSVVMAGAVINPDTKIGKGCIINTASSVDHDCIINDYVHVAVGAHICGTVCIGEKVWIGAGAIIINNIEICDKCKIGAGTVVIDNIDKNGVYAGVPARLIRGNE